MSTPPVVTEHLTKTFGPVRGVTDVSLTVEAGQVYGFLGPNGAGKTTTIRCLLGLYRPTRGRVLVLGRDATGHHGHFLRDVGYLPAELRLPDALTGADILARFGRMRKLGDTAYRDHLVRRFEAEIHRPLRTLSKGNKQKLGIVLAFMHRPRLLVLDEPTSGLDPLLQDEFATLLQETVAGGGTVLLSSHDLNEVQQVAHRLAIIREGTIIVDDGISALRASLPRTIELTFDHDLTPDLAQCSDVAGRLGAQARGLPDLPGVTLRSDTARHLTLTYTGSVAPVLAAVAALRPDSITARPTGLDELFRGLYGSAEGPVHAP